MSSTQEPIQMTVSANYIKDAPDLQMRLVIRALVIDEVYSGLSVAEKLELLRSEANRLERNQPKKETTC